MAYPLDERLRADEARSSAPRWVSDVLRAILEDDYEVACAAAAAEALVELARRRVDVVLLDYCLPGGDGRDIADRVSAPVVWMTGHPEALGALPGDSRPPLAKPFGVSAVLGAVAGVLAHSGGGARDERRGWPPSLGLGSRSSD